MRQRDFGVRRLLGETVKEQFESDLQLEYAAIAMLNQGVAKCREYGDNASEDLFTRILVSEEEHTDWLETQLELIRQIGEAHYLAQQVHD
jgi:bacterioferritin